MTTDDRKAESRSRTLQAIGIVLACMAYLVFLSTDSGLGLVCATVIACAGVGMSFYGLWTWNAHQERTRR